MPRPARTSRSLTKTSTSSRQSGSAPTASSAQPSRHSFEFYLVLAAMATVGLLVAAFCALVAFSLWMGWSQWRLFADKAGVTWKELSAEIEAGSQRLPIADQGHKNVLLLGVDSLAGRGDVPPLTDTMMLLSIDLQTATISAVSLPRDIWNEEYQTKINALYAYGLVRQPDQPTVFPTEIISQMTGVPIHHTMVVSLDQVAQVIDLLGGIPVTVETPFEDTQFPRADVDVTVERDPAKLYQTITFVAGPQTMSGERALQYIRSRHSEGSEGDDLARSRRQQQVINALITKLQDPSGWISAERLGKLYALYRENWAQTFPLSEFVATFRVLSQATNGVSLQAKHLPIYPEDAQGVLYHPPVSPQYQNQWVYSIREPELFKADVRALLNQPLPASEAARMFER